MGVSHSLSVFLLCLREDQKIIREDDKMRYGSIYKITNKTNNKVYIGQTISKLKVRWQKHCLDARKHISDTHFARAIRKYGEDNFVIEEIEKVNIEQLDEAEIKWISYYDSYKNGYNSTLGGGGLKSYDLDESEVIAHYSKSKSFYKTADYFGCSKSPIQAILHNNNIKRKEYLNNLNHDEVVKYYLNIKSAQKTADFFDCSREFILDILKEHNIKLYRVATGLRLGLDEEEVINYYLECRYLDKTANYFDCSEFTISKILHLNNIKPDGGTLYNLNEEEVIKYYLDCKLINKTAEHFGCCLEVVRKILSNNNVDRSKEPMLVYAIDKKGNRYDFDDIEDAVNYLIENGNSESLRPKKYEYKRGITKALKKEIKKSYGFSWYLKDAV